ncbi:lipid kinase [Facklamia sp. DSM 111018]|uniref:Lipid kinase n=1 Tax=Facklamia lactis TaxID=2749967 RepID=A0ABS0LQR1_9LACT|nr:diacylglycerol kinase family protein [Facklamia lactis]MBG9979696.1 lipid kinase [Facklamia lactis]MBG9985624.1 lipid kinase [Facklamia lactis]
MIEKVYIICNHEAGQGKGLKILNEVRDELDQYRIPYLIQETQYASHATTLATHLAQKYFDPSKHRLAIIGGDGSLHEVVSGLVNLGIKIPLSFFGVGTGNDFHRAYQKGKTTSDIVKSMLFEHEATEIKIGVYEQVIHQEKGAFVNSIGNGFDAEVSYNVQKMKLKEKLASLKLTSLAYLVSLFLSIKHLKYFEAEITVDGQKHHFDKCGFITTTNHPFFGGGIRLYPNDLTKESLLSCIIVHDLTPKRILSLFWQILVTQKHLGYPYTSRLDGEKIEIKTTQPLRTQIDGENQIKSCIHYQIQISNYPFYI